MLKTKKGTKKPRKQTTFKNDAGKLLIDKRGKQMRTEILLLGGVLIIGLPLIIMCLVSDWRERHYENEHDGLTTINKMTEEEADALDEFVTKYPPKVDPSKARYIARMVALDELSADYLFSVSAATNKTPSEIISELVREKIALSL